MRNFPSINYSLNYKNCYSLVKTIVEMQWGKVIDTHGIYSHQDSLTTITILF